MTEKEVQAAGLYQRLFNKKLSLIYLQDEDVAVVVT